MEPSARKHPLDQAGLILGIGFLLLQLALIVHARFIPERYFCWAPFDQCTRYRIEVSIGGKSLDHEAIGARYHIAPDFWDARAAANILSVVRRYETTLGRDDKAEVRIYYKVNGRPERLWKWPRPDV